jgi:hypothetical protein
MDKSPTEYCLIIDILTELVKEAAVTFDVDDNQTKRTEKCGSKK